MPNMAELKPTYFPSVPRIFEKIYTTATSAMEKEGGLKKAIFDWAIKIGTKVRQMKREGKEPGFLVAQEIRVRRRESALENPGAVRRQPAAGGFSR